MKQLLYCILLVLVIVSCKKDPDGKKMVPNSDDVLSFKFKFVQVDPSRSQNSLTFSIYSSRIVSMGHSDLFKDFSFSTTGAGLNGFDTTFRVPRSYFADFFNHYELTDANGDTIVSSYDHTYINDYTLAPVEIKY